MTRISPKSTWLTCAFLLFAANAKADLFYWTNSPGRLFSASTNWSPNGVPTASDSVIFTNAGAYTVTMDIGATNSAAFFHQGSISQTITGAGWWVTNEWRVGEGVGRTSRVTAISGLLAVTNDSRSGILSVGRMAPGELSIRGGTIVVDRLLATNGSQSVLAFGHGALNTLGGMTVNAGRLVVGTTAGNIFVWNVAGGMNRIITGPFEYGGLTLGTNSGGARA